MYTMTEPMIYMCKSGIGGMAMLTGNGIIPGQDGVVKEHSSEKHFILRNRIFREIINWCRPSIRHIKER
jgi:hypothetical protein